MPDSCGAWQTALCHAARGPEEQSGCAGLWCGSLAACCWGTLPQRVLGWPWRKRVPQAGPEASSLAWSGCVTVSVWPGPRDSSLGPFRPEAIAADWQVPYWVGGGAGSNGSSACGGEACVPQVLTRAMGKGWCAHPPPGSQMLEARGKCAVPALRLAGRERVAPGGLD